MDKSTEVIYEQTRLFRKTRIRSSLIIQSTKYYKFY